MTDITGFFNARQDGDTHAKSLFTGIGGDTSDTIISDLPTFLEAAGRDYGILRKPALVNDPFGGVDEHGNIVPVTREVEGQYHLTRTNDGRVVSPHTVTGQYEPLTLLDIAAEIQPWCDAGWVTPDAVYSGKNESLEVLCLRMDASGMLPNGEQWDHYIVFRNPHGSGGKAKGTIISYKPVCSNTFGAIGRGIEFSVTHRMSAKMTEEERQTVMAKRVAKAKAAWTQADKYIAGLAQRINAWNAQPLTVVQAGALTDTLLGIKPGADLTNREEVSKQAANKRDAIVRGFSMPQFGTNGATLGDWVNGFTFWNSSPNSESVSKSQVASVDRMIRNVDPNGSGYKLEAKALEIARRVLDGTITLA
jgi:hypothetical protein